MKQISMEYIYYIYMIIKEYNYIYIYTLFEHKLNTKNIDEDEIKFFLHFYKIYFSI